MFRNHLILFALLAVLATESTRAQRFVRITDSPAVAETLNSGGATWFDADGDGDLDLFVANGNLDEQRNSLFINDGGLMPTASPGDLETDLGSSIGATAGDYDGDGDLDLFVTNRGDGTLNFLYQNDAGTFTRVTTGDVATDREDSNSGSWVDVDVDGDLDLFVTNFDAANYFYRNDDGVLMRASIDPITTVVSSSINGSWADVDNDGDSDYFMGNGNTGDANDKLYRNGGDLTFAASSFADGAPTIGSSWGDFDDDGDLDLVGMHFLNRNNAFYVNGGSPDYLLEAIDQAPLTSDGGFSAGSAWGDVDNDGDLDLFVSNFNQANALYLNSGPPDYTFTKLTGEAVVTDVSPSFGAALADYDDDGDLDLYVANQNGASNFFYENRTSGAAWLSIDLLGKAPNTAAIGARVLVHATIEGTVRTQLREVTGQTGYNSQTLRQHVGLGDATSATVRVVWPSGSETVLSDVEVNQLLRIPERNSTGTEKPDGVKGASLEMYPNPSHGSVTIEYALHRPGHVRLVIYDLLGRTVRSLADVVQTTGPYHVHWDGHDGAGRRAPSGAYILALIQDDVIRAAVLAQLASPVR